MKMIKIDLNVMWDIWFSIQRRSGGTIDIIPNEYLKTMFRRELRNEQLMLNGGNMFRLGNRVTKQLNLFLQIEWS